MAAATNTGHEGPQLREEVDLLTLGRRIRHARQARGMTLAQLGEAVHRAPSLLSLIENGKREVRLSLLQEIAAALGVTLGDLLESSPPSRRAALEIALRQIGQGPVFHSLGLAPVRVTAAIPSEVLHTIVALHGHIQRLSAQRAATPEEARRANSALRATMRAAGNYFPDIERQAEQLLQAVGHADGPLSQREVGAIAAHLGFSLHYVTDLPHSTRSVTDLVNHRLYLPDWLIGARDPRFVVLQALADHVLGHAEPGNYAEFLHQRVMANYLAAALLLPAGPVVDLLSRAKAAREISIEDLRDEYSVAYETAAHRFTNLATARLDLTVHFLKVHSSGAIHKAYENDGLALPTDPMGAVEGQLACRLWAARRVFAAADRLSPYYQITDTPGGTYWCTAHVGRSASGEYSVSVGTPFDSAKYFRGSNTRVRATSRCPDQDCCRVPPADLASRWRGNAWPAARPHASLLAALPAGAFPGVDVTEVYTFLERHASS